MKKLLGLLATVGLTATPAVLPIHTTNTSSTDFKQLKSVTPKKAVYNADHTECLEIGYDAKGQIEQMFSTVKKVPETLPKEITSLSKAFLNNKNEKIEGIENWDTSNVTDMSYVFDNAKKFNQDISNWNTSNVTNMSWMFYNATSFNQDISNWNTSNVTNMSWMFYNATSFNQSLNNWKVSKAKNIEGMFFEANSFNQSLSNWDTSNVTNMKEIFYLAVSFNGDISNWNTSNVTDMSSMFEKNTSFNQDISNWNTSNVTNMSFMFRDNTSFNQDISSWDTSKVTDKRSYDVNTNSSWTTDKKLDFAIWKNANFADLKNNIKFETTSKVQKSLYNYNIDKVATITYTNTNLVSVNVNGAGQKLLNGEFKFEVPILEQTKVYKIDFIFNGGEKYTLNVYQNGKQDKPVVVKTDLKDIIKINNNDLGEINDNLESTIIAKVNELNSAQVDWEQLDLTIDYEQSIATITAKKESEIYTGQIELSFNVKPADTTTDLMINVKTTSNDTLLTQYKGQIDSSNMLNEINDFYFANGQIEISYSNIINFKQATIYGCDKDWKLTENKQIINNSITINGNELNAYNGRYFIELEDNLGNSKTYFIQVAKKQEISDWFITKNGKAFLEWANDNNISTNDILGASSTSLNNYLQTAKTSWKYSIARLDFKPAQTIFKVHDLNNVTDAEKEAIKNEVQASLINEINNIKDNVALGVDYEINFTEAKDFIGFQVEVKAIDTSKQLIKSKSFDINLNQMALIDLSKLIAIDLGEFNNYPTEDDILNQFVSLNQLENKIDLQVTNITDTSAVISAKVDSQNYKNEVQISFKIKEQQTTPVSPKNEKNKILIYVGITIGVLLVLGLFTLIAVKLKKRYDKKQAIKNTKRTEQIMKEIEEESKKD